MVYAIKYIFPARRIHSKCIFCSIYPRLKRLNTMLTRMRRGGSKKKRKERKQKKCLHCLPILEVAPGVDLTGGRKVIAIFKEVRCWQLNY